VLAIKVLRRRYLYRPLCWHFPRARFSVHTFPRPPLGWRHSHTTCGNAWFLRLTPPPAVTYRTADWCDCSFLDFVVLLHFLAVWSRWVAPPPNHAIRSVRGRTKREAGAHTGQVVGGGNTTRWDGLPHCGGGGTGCFGRLLRRHRYTFLGLI
jgi:hypothetical protein